MSVTAVIGAGFSGLSAAAYLAAAGHDVHVFEKNEGPGGRARQMHTPEGYLFDMGPSWYWMPDIFEKFFSDFNHQVSDFYSLVRLDPAFEMVFDQQRTLVIPDNFDALCALFDQLETKGGEKLKAFMKEAEVKYRLGMNEFVYKPSLSVTEYLSPVMFIQGIRIQLLTSLRKHIRKYFSSPEIISLMEFPVLFLGGTADRIPALYSLMNYAGLTLGTWYPMGGFGRIVEGMQQVAEENGAIFHFNTPIDQIEVSGQRASSLHSGDRRYEVDAVVASADYQHVEDKLIPKAIQNYKIGYWEHRTMSPSCLIYYLGIGKRIHRLKHHTLFFDEDLALHAKEIYDDPKWPTSPLFYVCCPSKTDPIVAPEGHENLFLLMPLAPGLSDHEEVRQKYFDIMMTRLEAFTGENIRSLIRYKKSYCINDFKTDYHAYKGNAYGLASTLSQTAFLRPRMRNQKIKNLYYAGQLTVPGPGVPPAIISGKIAATLLTKTI